MKNENKKSENSACATTRKWGKKTKGIFSSARGSILVETAISFPLLWIFLLAVIDLGRFATTYYNASRVTYEGVRYAAGEVSLRDGANEESLGSSSVITRMENLLPAYGIQTNDAQIQSLAALRTFGPKQNLSYNIHCSGTQTFFTT